MIAENQLEIWASQGPTAQFTDTYNRIRNGLLQPGVPYPLGGIDVFLQGSYKNDTNVFGDSDVDIVLCHTGAFYKDLFKLSADDRRAYDTAVAATGPVTYGLPEFKRDATAHITQLFAGVRPGKKALYVPGGNSGRRDADVLVAAQFRRYHEFKAWNDQRFDEGVCFFPPSGEMIENFPKQHADNCTAKHQGTKGYLKPMVRIFKNMRNAMIDKALIAASVAPSYFIEGMLYNVPNDKFRGSYQQAWVECFNHIVTANRDDLVCANHMHWLVRDNSRTSWPVANFNSFTAALKRYWES